MAKTEQDRLLEMKLRLEAEWDRLNSPKNGFGVHGTAYFKYEAEKRAADIAIARAQIGHELEKFDSPALPVIYPA